MTTEPAPGNPDEVARQYAVLRGEDILLAAQIVTRGFASQEDVTMALEEQERVFQAERVLPARVGEVLVEAELITPEQLAQLHQPPAPASRDAWLVVESGDGFGRPFAVGPRASIGRRASHEIPLRDAQASRDHALIEFDARAAVHVIRDSGSRNGTQVNHAPIHGPVALRNGDVVRIGVTMLRYVSISSGSPIPEGETQAIATAPPPPPPPPPTEDLEGEVAAAPVAEAPPPPPPPPPPEEEEVLEGEVAEAAVAEAPPPLPPPEEEEVLEGEVVRGETVSQFMDALPERPARAEEVAAAKGASPEADETAFEDLPTPPPAKAVAAPPPPLPPGDPEETEHDELAPPRPAPPPKPRAAPETADDAEAIEAARRTGRPVSDFQKTLLDNPVVPMMTRHKPAPPKPPPAAAPPPPPAAVAPPPVKVKLSFDNQDKPSLLDRAARLKRNRRFRR
jgi:hypothetical protein